jgi:DNA-binding CsgD family transcriptional regulator
MILEGLLAKDIGERLFISTYTVNEHITNIYRKLEEKRRPEFMALFVNAAKN